MLVISKRRDMTIIINVINPQVQLINPASIQQARINFALCGDIAKVSRFRLEDIKCDPTNSNITSELLPKAFLTFAEYEQFILSLLKKKPVPHEGILEHCYLTFVILCSRIMSHELVRTRVASYLQSSTRYDKLNGQRITFIRPPDAQESDIGIYQSNIDEDKVAQVAPIWLKSAYSNLVTYKIMLNNKYKVESARYVLPHCLATKIVMTANLRSLRHTTNMRYNEHAGPEIREVFHQIYDILYNISPVLCYGICTDVT